MIPAYVLFVKLPAISSSSHSDDPSAQDPYVQCFEQSLAFKKCSLISPMEFSLCSAQKLYDAISSPHLYSGIVFTSPRAVFSLHSLVTQKFENWKSSLVYETWSQKSIFSVGPSTAALLFSHLSLSSTGQQCGNGSVLANFISDSLKETLPLLYLCGVDRRDELPATLGERNVPFDEISVYKTQEVSDFHCLAETYFQMLCGEFSNHNLLSPRLSLCANVWLSFFSPKGVSIAAAALHSALSQNIFDSKTNTNYHINIQFAAIGKTTAQKLKDSGFMVSAIAENPTESSLLASILCQIANSSTSL